MNLFVDDCKPVPEGWAVARTVDDALSMLARFDYDIVSLDHDMGEARTGYDIVCAIERGEVRRPKHLRTHSWNGSGRQRIQQVIDRLYPEHP